MGLISDVLNYARIEAATLQYDIRAVPLQDALAACEALIACQCRAKQIDLHFMNCDADLTVRADHDRLQQIAVNLLTNAVKFTDVGGRIDLACEVVGGTVHVAVTDTGKGIAADQLDRIFEPFVQVDRRLAENQEGIGLGLAISRELAHAMAGELTVESAPEVGTRFTLALPLVAT